LLTGCVSFGPAPQQPSVDLTALPGTWVSSGDGASITFTPTNFTATNFNYGKVMPTCGTLSGSGTWQLHDMYDDYPPPTAGSPNNLLDLRFRSVSSPGRCTGGFLEMTTWDTGGKQGLCVQVDPDNPCDGYVFTKR
jgi:hypothetical protein